MNSAVVDWNARCFHPLALDVRAHVGMTRILDGEPPHASLAEHAADKANPLRRAGGEDDVLGLRDSCASAVLLRRQGDAGSFGAARIGTVKSVVGSLGERTPH